MKGPDVNDTLRAEGVDAVRARHDGAVPYRPRGDKRPTNGAGEPNDASLAQWLDMSSWDDGEPAPMEWAISGRVPRQQIGLFSGVGGAGKTIIELTKDVAHVTGLPWLNMTPVQGPTIYVGCEDTDNVLRTRLTSIAHYYNTTFRKLIAGGFHVMNLYGKDATIFRYNARTLQVETTALYKQLYEAAGDLKPINISLDPLARIFAGNEIDRTHAYGLAQHAQALAIVAGGSVTILSHPSLAGIHSGTGLSGSTAWHDAFRFRQYMRKPKESVEGTEDAIDRGVRELAFMKNQYGEPIPSITLRYQRGLFLPDVGASLDKAAREAKADDAFLAGLKQLERQGRDAIAGNSSPQFGPTLIAALSTVKQESFTKGELIAAMNRLLEAGKIHVGKTAGPPSKAKNCLRLGTAPTSQTTPVCP